MATFYFTYGLEGQPFTGGWTEVEAPDMDTACAVFRTVHPDRHRGCLNCGSVYNEEQFRKTSMYRDGNYGARCQERLALTMEVLTG